MEPGTRRAWARALVIVAIGGCVDASGRGDTLHRELPVARAPLVESSTDNVVLVTVDGVRWQELFGGVDARLSEQTRLPSGRALAEELFPNVRRLFFEHGTVIGDPRLPGGIEASGPHYVSLPGYLEILTGATTPCRDNDCGLVPGSTLLDEIERETGAPRERVAAITSWESLGRVAAVDASRVVVRSGRTSSDVAPAYPGNRDYRPDHSTAPIAIEHLLAHRPRFLWVSLGDTDEWAHRHDYRGYLEALRFADAFLGELAAHLEEMGDYGARTALFVTTDHGRDGGFADHGGSDSARVWLLARGGSVPRRGAIGTNAVRHLRDVAPTMRALLRLPVRSCDECGRPIEELAGGP